MPITSPTRSNQILLLGAGELGLALLHYIPCLPYTQITVGIRSPTKYNHLLSTYPSISLLALDLTSPSSTLIPIFSNYDIIISATGFVSGSGSVTKLAKEVLAAERLRQEESNGGKDKLWFFPWQWGVDYDITGDGEGLMTLFGEQRDVTELLRAQAVENGVNWTVVSTGIFMSFLFEEFWGIVDRTSKKEENKVIMRCLGSWEHKVTVTDVQDVGRVVKEILRAGNEEVESENGVVYVAGDTISYGELADLVQKVSKFSVVRETWSIAHLKKGLDDDPGNEIKRYRLVFARDGAWWPKEKTVNYRLGMEMKDVKEYAFKLFGIQECN